jgi:hypothetical protein
MRTCGPGCQNGQSMRLHHHCYQPDHVNLCKPRSARMDRMQGRRQKKIRRDSAQGLYA